MTQSDLQTGSLGVRQPARLDLWLNLTVALLVALLLGGAAYFGYSVYNDRKIEESSSAPGRIAAALEPQVRKSPNDAILRVRLGEAYGAMGKYSQAIEQFNAALKIDPKHTGAYLDLGMVAMLTKNFAAATGYFQKVISVTEGERFQGVDSVREQAFYNLGTLALDDKRYTDAAGYFKAALRIRRDASDTYYRLARALQGLGDVDGAIQQLEIAVQFDPGLAEAHYYLGQLYQQKKDDVNASYQFAEAVKLAPGADPPRQALDAYGTAAEWIDKSKKAQAAGDSEAAINDILIARNLDPSSLAAAKLHAEMLVKKGDVAGALKVYQEAAKLDPKDAEVQSKVAALTKQVASAKKKASKK